MHAFCDRLHPFPTSSARLAYTFLPFSPGAGLSLVKFLTAESACGVDAAASPAPQVRSQHRPAAHPVTTCTSSLRRKRGVVGPQIKVTNAQAVGAGSIANEQLVGQRSGKCRCQVHIQTAGGSGFQYLLPPPRQSVIDHPSLGCGPFRNISYRHGQSTPQTMVAS